ncbi:RNA polymerase Rpb4 [Candidatus Geothermarchaeota archaeon]|nr:MAG: RNA polymerase Rpb4 [Candidatus Geothermarchaeota archaeon]
MVRKILKERKLTIGEVLDILSKEESLGQFQQRVLDYVKKMAKVDAKRGRELIKKLIKIGDITEDEAVQIVNIMPESKEELKTIFYHRKTIIMEEFLNKILKVLRSE